MIAHATILATHGLSSTQTRHSVKTNMIGTQICYMNKQF